MYIKSISVTYTSGGGSTTPTITATPTTLAVPNQVVNAYDGTQTATLDVEGSNLTDNVTIALNDGTDSKFEMTIDNGQTWHNTLSLEQNGGEVAIRLKDNLEVGDYNDVITLSSEGATDVTVNVSGSVTTPPTYTVTYNSHGGSGTMTDDNSPYLAGVEVTLLENTFTAPEGMIWDSWQVKDADNNDVTVSEGSFIMPASNVTVTAQWKADPDAPEYEWVLTNLADLTENDVFVIVGTRTDDTYGGNYAMPNNGGANAPTATAITVAHGKLSTAPDESLKWNLSGNNTNGYIIRPNGSTTTFLYGLKNNNGVRVGTGQGTYSNLFTLAESGYLSFTVDNETRYVGIYQAQDWRCYTSPTATNIKDQTFSFYKRQVASNEPSITLASYEVEVNANAHTTPTTIAVTYANIDFENDFPEVVFYEQDGSTEAIYDWLFVDLDADWNVYYTVEENTSNVARTAYFKVLGYDSNANNVYSNLASITQAAAPVVYTTIPDLFVAATSTATDVNVQFNNWVVTGVSTNGRNVFVTDGTNGFAIYDGSGSLASTYAVGNTLTGLASCKLKLQNGYAQLQDVNAADLTIGTGGSVDFATITMADLAGVNTGALVQYDNLTCSVDNNKYYLTDGTTTLQVYNSLYADAYSTLVDGKTYNIKGVYQQYNTTKEILPRSADDIEEVVSDEPSITLASYEVEVNANAHTTPTTIAVTYANIDFENDVPKVVFYESDGSTETTYDWLFVDLDADWNVYYTIEENTNNAARTAYFKVLGYDSNGNNVYSDLASITQHEFEPDYADLPYDFNGGRANIENENGLTQEGLGTDYSDSNSKLKFDHTGDYLVLKINPSQFPKAITFNIKGNSFSGGTFAVQVSEDGETYTDLATYTDSEITSSNQTITLLNTNDNVKYIKWIYTEKVQGGGNIGIGNIYVDDEYKVRGNATVSEDLTLDKCTIQESGKLTIKKSGTLNVTNALTNEATSEAWNNLIIEDGGQLKISNSVNGTVLKNITGYSSYTGTGNGGYYLIATPATLDATGETNMFPSVASDHQYVDFYGFNQTMVAEEWRNYKYGNDNGIFAGPLGMEQGQGYLYASKNDVTLTLKTIGLGGMLNNSYVHTDYPFVPTNVDKIVEVSYNAEGINGQEVVFKGYNLIGNPFTCKAYLADDRDFYRMNEAGDKIVVATDKAINVAEGIFVIAESGETNVTFTTTDPTVTSTGGVLNITLSQAQSNRGNAATIDAARIRFGEGRMLPKFNFMGNNGGISIPQGSKDYAVVRSQGEGELPVNFKADKNGAYTLSIRPENVEMDYLHLIDNLTGAEVDLLATPTYTFNAKKTDYASRFRLVFSTTGVEENGTETNASFAFFNGSEWVVNANDNATLEVIDMMGRTVLCKDVARNVSTNGWAQGVYVIRLTDNNSVKTQKIVVR